MKGVLGEMSAIKRWLEDQVESIADKSGYTYDEVMDACMAHFEYFGKIDLKLIEQEAMEHDLPA